jgi:hypothetical protein
MSGNTTQGGPSWRGCHLDLEYFDQLPPTASRRRGLTMPYITIQVDPLWRCPCGAPVKAFDFHVEPDEIVLDCRRCQRRLLVIESNTSSDKSAA